MTDFFSNLKTYFATLNMTRLKPTHFLSSWFGLDLTKKIQTQPNPTRNLFIILDKRLSQTRPMYTPYYQGQLWKQSYTQNAAVVYITCSINTIQHGMLFACPLSQHNIALKSQLLGLLYYCVVLLSLLCFS